MAEDIFKIKDDERIFYYFLIASFLGWVFNPVIFSKLIGVYLFFIFIIWLVKINSYFRYKIKELDYEQKKGGS